MENPPRFPVFEVKPTEEYCIQHFLKINGWFFGVEGELIKLTKMQDLHTLRGSNPNKMIFHGTGEKNLLSIMEHGIIKPSDEDPVFLSSYFGKALNYGLLHPERDNSRIGLILVDFDHVWNAIKKDIDKNVVTLYNPDVTDWQAWYIIRLNENITSDFIKAIFWVELKNFSPIRSRILPYYAGFINKILEVQNLL